MRRQRPAVVAAGQDGVDLVAATRAELGFPQGAGGGVEGQAVRVAMAIAEDFRPYAGPAEEGVARGRRAIALQSQHLAGQVVQPLGAHLVGVAVPGGEVELAVLRPEGDAAAELQPSPRLGRRGVEDWGYRFQRRCVSGEPSADQPGQHAAGHLGGVAEVQFAGGGEVGRQGQVQQAALAAFRHRRHAGQGRRDAAIPPDQAHAPGLFRQQQPTIRQEGAAPGVVQPVGESLYPEARGLGGDDAGRRLCRAGGSEEQAEAEDERSHGRHVAFSRSNARAAKRSRAIYAVARSPLPRFGLCRYRPRRAASAGGSASGAGIQPPGRRPPPVVASGLDLPLAAWCPPGASVGV